MVRATGSATTKKRKRNKWVVRGRPVGLCRTLFFTRSGGRTFVPELMNKYLADKHLAILLYLAVYYAWAILSY